MKMENVEQSKHSLGSTLVLALGTFAVGMDAFIVSAFLPEMAEDLSVSASMAGWSVTAFALAYALLAPVIATMTSTVARRRLLVSSLLLLGVSNIASAACTTLALLILTRVAAAASAAAYTPNAGATAAAMVHPSQRARALSVVIGGLTVATALGVPLGHAISVFMNWRASLAFVGVLSFAAAATVFLVMKPMPGGTAIGLRQRLSVLAKPGVVGILMLTVFGMAAAYSAYAFIISILEGFQIPPANFTMMLFMYGLGAFCGNYLSGWATDRHGPIMTLACAYLVMTLALGGLGLMPSGKELEAIYPISFLIACWGASSWAQSPAQQQRLISLAPQEANLVIALNSSGIYIGIAIGTMIGGQLIGLGGSYPLWAGAALAAIAMCYIMMSGGTGRQGSDRG
ncbi:MFS transporter [Achromobacter xylosoxidans]|uniref:MFS transporter n=2 Tax=Alcaligenes xylosoxydans xylosoxydans TaxID=85698 RepID=A0A1R1K237_ALCXX|nr:MFS transporter [Achromobacter xylosoxidans]